MAMETSPETPHETSAAAAAAALSGAPPRVCIVLPTYNEAENITPLLQQIMALEFSGELLVLVVDGNSPDGTAQLVRQFAAGAAGAAGENGAGRVHLLTGPKRGLGAAYRRGMAHALHQLHADIVMEMDADFSHDPRTCLTLINMVQSGAADLAIGSRYVAGAAIDKRWHFFRLWLSKGGIWLTRTIAGIGSVQDCTSGFRAIRGALLRQVELQDVRFNGYAFQIALLHRLMDCGARVAEHPIYFQDRLRGETKLGLRDIAEFFVSVWMLRFPNVRTFVKFALTGLSGVLVNLAAFALLTAAGVGKYFASPLAIAVSIQSNFFLNNYWTFRRRAMRGRKLTRGLRFNAASLITLGLSFATFTLLSKLLPNWPPLLHQGAAIVPASIFNYFLNSSWTFRERKQ